MTFGRPIDLPSDAPELRLFARGREALSAGRRAITASIVERGAIAISSRATRLGALLMTVSLVLVLATNALARELAGAYPVGEILFFRFLGALPLVLLIANRAGVAPFSRRRLATHAARAVSAVAGMAALYVTSRHLPFSDLIAIAYSSPILVALFATPLLGERVGRRRFLLILGGFAGVILVAFPGRLELWSFGALAMATLSALSAIAARDLSRTESAVTIACQFALFGALLSIPLLALGWRTPDSSDIPALAALGLCAGLAIQFNALAFRHAAASVLTPIDYMGVLFSIIMGFVIWSEIPTLWMIVGGAIIVSTGVLQIRAAEAEGRRA
jgi:drug/metabolite transporter (DMT)-like permease